MYLNRLAIWNVSLLMAIFSANVLAAPQCSSTTSLTNAKEGYRYWFGKKMDFDSDRSDYIRQKGGDRVTSSEEVQRFLSEHGPAAEMYATQLNQVSSREIGRQTESCINRMEALGCKSDCREGIRKSAGANW